MLHFKVIVSATYEKLVDSMAFIPLEFLSSCSVSLYFPKSDDVCDLVFCEWETSLVCYPCRGWILQDSILYMRCW